MSAGNLSVRYHDYITCLNKQDWARLDQFVAADVRYNDELVGLPGYIDMLKGNYRDIPDLHFTIELLVCEPPHIASRLGFDCTPIAPFLGLELNGHKVSFAENVFYRLVDGKIVAVWSIVDKAAIEAQLKRS